MDSRLVNVSKLLSSVQDDLKGLNRERYQAQLQCLEELVEALSFAHYLQHQKLISLEEASAAVPAGLGLTDMEYIYGLFDIFGELMRFATATADSQSESADGRSIARDMQDLGSCFEILPAPPGKKFRIKLQTMRSSIQKVERLGYETVIHSAERPKGYVPDLQDDGGYESS
jgi:predicted translin family RNA/ssDNA-binding protein